MPEEREHRLELAMGRMLQIGVTVAAFVVLAGGILYLMQAGGAHPDYHHFRATPSSLETISGIVAAANHLDPRGIMELGMLLLIATPVCRVLFGVVGFAVLHDRLYVAVSTIVLVILLFSFFSKR